MNTCGYSPYVTSSLKRRWDCRLQLMLVLASAFVLRSEYHEPHDHILLSQTRESPRLEGQVPVFISPRNRVAQLYPQALGSLFVTSYDSQGYGGSIRPRLHMEFSKINSTYLTVLLIASRHGQHRKHRSSVAVYGPFPSSLFRGRCLAKGLRHNILVAYRVALM
jgi:hypothetical protein